MRKPIIIILFALLGILSARAADFTVNGIYYNILSGTDAPQVEVTKVTSGSVKYSGSVVIPTTVEYDGTTYSVTAIGDEAFMYCSDLTSVTIGEGVTSIGYYAFCLCSGLTSVTIPNSVTSIGILAFNGCSSLTSVTIPNSVTTIRADAFSNCSGLTSVTIPESVTSIGNNAFKGCSSLTSVEWNAINCQNFTASSTHFPNTLSSITFGDKVESIPAYLCYESGLTSVTIPNSVTSIGESAFYGCSDLTSVTIPNNVISIGEAAFSYCRSLASVTIPNSVTSIGAFVFSGTGLTSVEWNARNCPNRYIFPMFPNTLTSITFGDKVELIPAYMCNGCSGLTSVTIPNSVITINDQAFSGCGGLTSVTIDEGVTSIGNYAFSGCSGLTSVTIPENVISIGIGSFTGCSALTSVTSLATVPPTCGSNAFAVHDHDTLYVSCGSKTAYQTAEGWSSFSEIIGIGCVYVTLSVNDETMGSVTGEKEYALNEQATLEAIPNEGYHFVKWSDDNTDNPRVLTVMQDTSLMAVFAKDEEKPDEPVVKTFTVSVSANNPAWGNASQSGNGTYDSASSVTITATPNEGYRFVNWTKGNAVFSAQADTTFTIKENLELVANFEKIPDEPIVIKTFMVSVSANNPEWGSTSQSGNGTYDSAASVTVTATPNEGYRFVNWTKDNAVFSAQADTTFTIKENLALVANFEKIPDEPVANENRQGDHFRVYVQDRTIHLSESRGLVQVYNMAGQRVYNGHATAIPVPQSGVYIVAVGQQRFKVLVR